MTEDRSICKLLQLFFFFFRIIDSTAIKTEDVICGRVIMNIVTSYLVSQINRFICSFFFFLIGGKFLYTVVLVSAIQQCKSAIIIHISPPSGALSPPPSLSL